MCDPRGERVRDATCSACNPEVSEGPADQQTHTTALTSLSLPLPHVAKPYTISQPSLSPCTSTASCPGIPALHTASRQSAVHRAFSACWGWQILQHRQVCQYPCDKCLTLHEHGSGWGKGHALEFFTSSSAQQQVERGSDLVALHAGA